MEDLEKYLEAESSVLMVVYDFDKNGNEYNHEFFICKEGETPEHIIEDDLGWKLEDIGFYEIDIMGAVDLGLKNTENIRRYKS